MLCARPGLEKCTGRYGIVLGLEQYEEAAATDMGMGPRTMAMVLVGTMKWSLELDDIVWSLDKTEVEYWDKHFSECTTV